MSKKLNWSNYFIELLIVIIGITVAFWLNNLASTGKEKKLEETFIIDLKEDLQKDSILLVHKIRFNEDKIERLKRGFMILQKDKNQEQLDSVIAMSNLIGNYDFFNSESYMLGSLLQSGDIKLITSRPIKKELIKLIKLYDIIDESQRNHLQALDNNYFPALMTRLDLVTDKTNDPDWFYSVQMRNYFAFSMNDVNNIVGQYKYALNQINVVLREIDQY